MKLQNILSYTAKWNCYNLSGASLKMKKFPLKNWVIKIIFFQRDNKLFDLSEIEDFIRTWDKNHLT